MRDRYIVYTCGCEVHEKLTMYCDQHAPSSPYLKPCSSDFTSAVRLVGMGLLAEDEFSMPMSGDELDFWGISPAATCEE